MFSQVSVILLTGGCLADTPQQMTTEADGTHPNGMHSCFNVFFVFQILYQYSLSMYLQNLLMTKEMLFSTNYTQSQMLFLQKINWVGPEWRDTWP